MLRRKYRNDGLPLLKLNDLQKQIKMQIDKKVDQRIYKFEFVSCCICNNNKFIKLSNKDRYGLYMPVVICPKCGLIQTNPRMTKDSYYEFYNNEYRKLYMGIDMPNNEFFFQGYNKGKKIYQYLLNNKLLRKTSSNLFVFEVGSSSGGILYYFSKKGCYIKGVDIDHEYIEFGKKIHDLDIFAGTVKNVKFDKYPDIIIYSHVLEHISNLKEEISRLHKIMSEKSLLYIEVPGVKNLTNNYNLNFLRYLQNAHTYHFTLTTLKNLLETNGFKLIIGNEIIQSVFTKSDKPTLHKSLINDYFILMKFLNNLENLKPFYYFKYLLKKIIRQIKTYNLPKIYDLYIGFRNK